MQITKTFSFEKETKGAVRFKEDDVPEGGEAAIGTLYLRKSALGAARPETLKVTIDLDGDES